jgi:gliding motility-associated-like protein
MPTQITIPANDSIVTIPIFPIPDNIVEGDETFKIYITFGSCGAASNFYADSLTILVRDQLRGTATVTPSNCSNNAGTITVSVPAGNGNTPYTYALNGGNFQASNMFTGLPTGTSLVTVRDSNGCVHNIVTNIGLTNNLALVALPADTAICKGATFVPRITSAATQYSWSPTAGLSSSTVAQPTITITNNAQYVLTAYQGPCVRTATINITALQPPTVSAGPDVTMINGDVIQLAATAGPGTYLWTPATGLSSATVLQPMASPSQTQTYTLTATSPQGCISTDKMTLTVLDCVSPMDAFTPNGDGINDKWLVNLRACYTRALVEVFNRYGNRVFRSENYQNDWDGRWEGKALPDGTYYYVITLELINGKKTYVKGNVSILR